MENDEKTDTLFVLDTNPPIGVKLKHSWFLNDDAFEFVLLNEPKTADETDFDASHYRLPLTLDPLSPSVPAPDFDEIDPEGFGGDFGEVDPSQIGLNDDIIL